MLQLTVVFSMVILAGAIFLRVWVSNEIKKERKRVKVDSAITVSNETQTSSGFFAYSAQQSRHKSPQQSEGFIDVPGEYSDYKYLVDRLKKVGLDTEGMFESGPIPFSLLTACLSLAEKPFETQRSLVEGLKSEVVYCPRLAYGSFSSWTQKIRDAWAEALKATGRKLIDIEEHCVYSARADHIAERFKYVFRYPFFQTRTSCANYPIFKIGIQREIGVLFPTKAGYRLALEECKKLKASLFDDYRDSATAGHEALKAIMKAVVDHDDFVISRHGYAFDEIFMGVLEYENEPRLVEEFGARLKVIDIEMYERQDQSFSGVPTSIPRSFRDLGGLYLFDPANEPTADVLKFFPGTEMFILPHKLEIPVGFAFTLPMLHELSKPAVRRILFKEISKSMPPPDVPGILWDTNSMKLVSSAK